MEPASWFAMQVAGWLPGFYIVVGLGRLGEIFEQILVLFKSLLILFVICKELLLGLYHRRPLLYDFNMLFA